MKVLYIAAHWPEPKGSAAGRRSIELLLALQRAGHRITVGCSAERTPLSADLSVFGFTTKALRINCSSINPTLASLSPDIVIFERFFIEEQFSFRVRALLPETLCLLDTQDLHCLRLLRHQALKKNKPLAISDFNDEKALRELAAIYRSDLSLMISEAEVTFLTQQLHVPASLLFHLPFMPDDKVPAPPGFLARKDFCFIGTFRHAPNWDAVLYLKQMLWPKIRAQLPKAKLFIYGSYPPKKATALHAPAEGFLVKGFVDDALQAIASTRVMLAPLRFGAGVKGKLLEAMLTATPSVTTTIGAEGMLREGLWPGVIADAVDAQAEAAVTLYRDEANWQLASSACDDALNYFDPKQYSNTLQRRLVTLESEKKHTRDNNLIGAMLKLEQHQSHYYMSRWIEQKNLAKLANED